MEKKEENNLLLLKKRLAELKALVQEINQSLKENPPPKDNQNTDN